MLPQRSPTTTRPSASPRRSPGSPTSCPCGGRSWAWWEPSSLRSWCRRCSSAHSAGFDSGRFTCRLACVFFLPINRRFFYSADFGDKLENWKACRLVPRSQPSSLFSLSFSWQVLLQVLIILTGNYNFFNLLTLALCLSLLDDQHVNYWLKKPAGPRKKGGRINWTETDSLFVCCCKNQPML